MWFVWGGGTLSLEGHHNFEVTPKNGSLRVKRLCCVFKCLSVTSITPAMESSRELALPIVHS